MTTPDLPIKKLGLPFVLAGLLLLLVVIPVLSAQVTILDDGFERPTTFELWDENGTTEWTTSPITFTNGLRSARARNNNEGFLTSDNLDTSDALSITVDFWFLKTKTSDTDFTLYYYDGSSYDLITELDGLGADDTWLHYTQTITDSQYFRTDFRIRFDATLGSATFVYVDDVLITKNTGATLTISFSGSGSGTVTSSPAGIDCSTECSADFELNEEVTLSAAAVPGSTFTGWSDSGCSGTGDCILTMDVGKSVTATFTQDQYSLTTDLIGQGSVEKDPNQITYVYDDDVTLTATADPGWTFAGWSGDLTSTDNPAQITIQDDTVVTATFTQDQYTLSTNVIGQGSVEKAPDQITYLYNDVATLTATADPGWAFAGWSGDLTSTDNPAQITIQDDTVVTATFTQDQYTLTTDVIGDGSVEKDPDQLSYDYGNVVDLTATADPGWSFSGWSGDLTSTDNPAQVTIQGDTVVTATFTQDQYTLTTDVSGQGSIDKDPDQITYLYDDAVTLTATADPGWAFVGWSGGLISTDNPAQVTIQGDTVVTATFILETYILSVIMDGTGSGSVTSSPAGIDCGLDCSEDYEYNTLVTLSAVAGINSTLTGWSGGGCTGTSDCIVTVDAAKSVTATFTQTNFPMYLPIINSND